MQYRVAVAYQHNAWEKGSSELTKLFAFMKETECQRRMDLREYMVAFMQRQERLFSALPDLHTPVLKDLSQRDMDRSSLEGEIQGSIRKRAERLQREDLKAKENEPPKKTGLTDAEQNAQASFALESPLLSELLSKAKVIERKGMGMISTWRVCLGVVTTDSYLHMFDIPGGRVSLGSAPEVAFQALVPKVEIPSPESVKAGKTNFIKGWCENLTPTESMNLHNCKFTVLRDGSSLDVQETSNTTGASKVFAKTMTRKVTIRTGSRRETQDWMVALNEAQEQ
mmetsp:Transcript_13004/g.30258  ORF Transcript_13004/g.30258 Transcript_13004/m.30258 type:complete len:282 (+) Transcript_13004:900-1745(+)